MLNKFKTIENFQKKYCKIFKFIQKAINLINKQWQKTLTVQLGKCIFKIWTSLTLKKKLSKKANNGNKNCFKNFNKYQKITKFS